MEYIKNINHLLNKKVDYLTHNNNDIFNLYVYLFFKFK